MREQQETLQELRAVIADQQELLRICLHVMTQGPVQYKWQLLSNGLDSDKIRAAAGVAMGAGQSLNTLVKLSEEKTLIVRDMYGIARTVIEAFINAAFFVTQSVDVAQRAIRHVEYASWKHHNRIIGSGEMMFAVNSDEDQKKTLQEKFPEFAGKGQGSWTTLDAPSRIDRIGREVRAAGGALLGAYGMIYAVSSEIIHGSVYGMSYFYSSHTKDRTSVESFRDGVQEQLIDILSAASHAASGFLAAYANTEKFGPIVLDEHELFKRMYKAATGDEWVGGDEP
jgi:hypothetical protein